MGCFVNSVFLLAVAAGIFFLGCSQPSASNTDSQPDVPFAEPIAAMVSEATEPNQKTIDPAEKSESFFTVDHYDPQRDAVDDLAMTVAKAAQSNKRILIEVGGKW